MLNLDARNKRARTLFTEQSLSVSEYRQGFNHGLAMGAGVFFLGTVIAAVIVALLL